MLVGMGGGGGLGGNGEHGGITCVSQTQFSSSFQDTQYFDVNLFPIEHIGIAFMWKAVIIHGSDIEMCQFCTLMMSNVNMNFCQHPPQR